MVDVPFDLYIQNSINTAYLFKLIAWAYNGEALVVQSALDDFVDLS